LGNKSDLKKDDSLHKKAIQFSKINGIKYFKVSAKTGEMINDCINFPFTNILSVIDKVEKKIPQEEVGKIKKEETKILVSIIEIILVLIVLFLLKMIFLI
jgi:hypothetical protein